MQKLLAILGPAGFLKEDVTAMITGVRSIVLQSASPDMKHEALKVLVTAIDGTYILIIISGAILIACSMFMKRERITMQLHAGG